MIRGQVTGVDPLRVRVRGNPQPVRPHPTSVAVQAGDEVLVAVVDRQAYIVVRVEPAAPPEYGNLLLRAQSNGLDVRGFAAAADTTIGVRRYPRRNLAGVRLAADGTSVATVAAATVPVATHEHTSLTGHAAGRVLAGDVKVRVGHRAFDAAESVVGQYVSPWASPVDPRAVRWDVTLPAETVAAQVVVQAQHPSGLPDGQAACEFSRLGLIVGVNPVTQRADWCAGGQFNTTVHTGGG